MNSFVSSVDILEKVKSVLEKKIPDVIFQFVQPETIDDLSEPIVVCSQIDSKEDYAVGIGSLIGKNEVFHRANVKAISVDCTLIFDIWAKTIEETNKKARQIADLVISERNVELKRKNILRISLTKSDVIETKILPKRRPVGGEEDAYRKRLYFETVSELTFQEGEDAKGDKTSIEVGFKQDDQRES